MQFFSDFEQSAKLIKYILVSKLIFTGKTSDLTVKICL